MAVDLDFVQIDSWDSEQFYVYADDALVYTSNKLHRTEGSTNECGGSSSTWNENVNSVSFTFAHSSSSLTLKITTNLNSAGTDESWGIQKINLDLINPDLINPFSIDFGESEDLCNQYAADGAWTDETGATVACTTCGSFGSLLGGYNTLATGSSVQKDFTDLSTHTYVAVDLDFVQIDSWDWRDDFTSTPTTRSCIRRTNFTGTDGSTNVCGGHLRPLGMKTSTL